MEYSLPTASPSYSRVNTAVFTPSPELVSFPVVGTSNHVKRRLPLEQSVLGVPPGTGGAVLPMLRPLLW